MLQKNHWRLWDHDLFLIYCVLKSLLSIFELRFLILVKLFQVGADEFVKYMTSPYPSEEDVINKASKKIRQIFNDDNFTSFMLNTNTKVNETIPWDLTSMNTIKMLRGMSTIVKENFEKTQLNENTGIH